MKILGIDPGYDRLGVAIVLKEPPKKEELLFSDCLESSRIDSLPERFKELGLSLEKIIKMWKPNALAIETLYMGTNQKTAIAVAEARGMVLYIAARAGLRVFEYSPQAVKIAITGYGKSTKDQISAMIPRLVSMTKKKARDDEYDAIAVALTCAASERNF